MTRKLSSANGFRLDVEPCRRCGRPKRASKLNPPLDDTSQALDKALQ